MKHTFNSKYSRFIFISTVITMLIIHVGFIYCIKGIVKTSLDNPIFYISTVIFITLVIGLMIAFTKQIKSITITEKDVVINKKIGSVKIPINTIKEVKLKKHMKYDIRLFGISFLFGHYGYFTSYDSGKYIAYIKDTTKLLMIITNKKKYVVSCENHKKALELINNNIKNMCA